MSSNIKQTVEKLFNSADIKINGGLPWDISIKNEQFYARVLSGGSLAFGESYMDGWWECQAIDELVYKILKADLNKNIKFSTRLAWNLLKAKLQNQQNYQRAKIVGEKHYDIGNELYRLMLGETMNYSCAYWKNASTLDEAQTAKLDLICRKLKLSPGMSLLDIGCGWGAMAKFAAENYGVKVFGITISKEQSKLAKERCQGLDVEIKLIDYRDLHEKFDRIVSIGMFEHVGYKNYQTYFQVVDRCLKDDGLFLLHTIGANKSSEMGDLWINKYIFPNGLIPSAKQITSADENIMQLEDWQNFGAYYDRTLMAWHKNFNDNWDKLKNNYDERFKRMWNFYLLSSAATFRVGHNHLWQIVFSKKNNGKLYESVR